MKNPGPNLLEQILDQRKILDAKIQGTSSFWPAIYHDDFSGPLNWLTEGTGEGYVVEAADSAALSGQKGLLLQTRTTDPAEDDSASAGKYLFLKRRRILRVRVACQTLGTNPKSLVKIVPSFCDGTYQYHADIYLDFDQHTAGYLVPDNDGYALVYPDGWELYAGHPTWNYVDLRINLKTKKWTSVTINEFHAEPANQLLYRSDHVVPPYLHFVLRIEAKIGASVAAAFDQLLITAEDPTP